jgi:hypothetical protein
MTRLKAFVYGLFLASIFYSLPSSAAPTGEKADANSVQSEVHRLLSDAQAAELDGEVTRRETLLREALVIDPDCEAARWQLGQIKVDDKWQPVAELGRGPTADFRTT